MKLYSPTIDRDGNPGSQPSPFRPELDWPALEEFAPGDLTGEATQAEAAAADAQTKYNEHERRLQDARDTVRREREQAEISGELTGDAELFYEMTLRPKLTEAHDFRPSVRVPIVQGLFNRNTLSWTAGPSGTFKSFVTADLAFRYGSEDMDYHGRKMTHGRALIIVAEGDAGYADRKTAWEKQYQREVKNVVLYPGALQLADINRDMPALLKVLREEDEAGNPFTLIVIDTQAMCTVGVDENSSEMNLVINVMHRIRKISGACVIPVHHFGKSQSKGMRGSSMLYAAADTVLILKRKDDALDVTLSTAQSDEGKQKDNGGEKDFLTLEMRVHTVSEDYFGDPVSSLVAVKAEVSSTDDRADHPELPDFLPDVTVDQMFYLKLLAFYEDRGATPSDMASKLEETRGPMRNGRQNVRNRMIELAKLSPPLVAQPVAKGPWAITPMGTATIARQLALGDRWVELSGPRRRVKPVDNPVDNQVSLEVSGALAKPASETSET